MERPRPILPAGLTLYDLDERQLETILDDLMLVDGFETTVSRDIKCRLITRRSTR